MSGVYKALLSVLLLSGCGPVTAVALLQNNPDLLRLVRRANAPTDSPTPPQEDTQEEAKEKNDGPQ